jgi:Cof subfamily protein (haloacid dehalogenase superfamily)
MSYRLVALDLDGTLLDSHFEIRPESVVAIAELRRRGIGVMIVTGRHHVAVAPYHRALDLDLPAICCNGTYLFDFQTGEARMGKSLSHTQALFVLKKVRERGVHALMYLENAITYERSEPHLAHLLAWSATLAPSDRPAFVQVENFESAVIGARVIWKFALSHPFYEPLGALVADLEREMGLACEWSGENRVDIAQGGNSKGNLLSKWLEMQGIVPPEVVAFGDGLNDISMLKLVGLGVAMGNSTHAVQIAANRVAGSHNSSAIADILSQYVLTA